MDTINEQSREGKCAQMIQLYYPITFCKGFKSVLSTSKYHNERLTASKEIKIKTELLIKKYIEVLDNNPRMFCSKQNKTVTDLKTWLRSINIHSCKCSMIDRMNKRLGINVPSISKHEESELINNERELSFVDSIFTSNEFQTKRLEKNEDYDKYYGDLYNEMLTGNAFYDRVFKSQLIIPPGMFVFPYYSKNYMSWQLYSNLMAGIAHEIAHSVDIFFYQNNNLSFEENKCYETQMNCIVSLYDQYNPDKEDEDMGKKTVVENKADMMGLYIAYYTWMDSKENKNTSLLNNSKQHFFIFYHQRWCQSDE